MPSIKETMQSLFKHTLMIATHPDEVIAEGAVIQATLRLEHKRSFHFSIHTLLFSAKDTSTYSTINNRYSHTGWPASTGDCGGRRCRSFEEGSCCSGSGRRSYSGDEDLWGNGRRADRVGHVGTEQKRKEKKRKEKERKRD